MLAPAVTGQVWGPARVPRTATPLINHLGHRVVTALCARRGARGGRGGTYGEGCGGTLLATSHPLSAAWQGCFWQDFTEAAGVKRREDAFENWRPWH